MLCSDDERYEYLSSASSDKDDVNLEEKTNIRNAVAETVPSPPFFSESLNKIEYDRPNAWKSFLLLRNVRASALKYN